MDKTLIFTITTGRSGTAFLAEFLVKNIQGIRAYHERTAPATFGVDTPDASDLMQFNNFGLTKKVRTFWRRKLQRILSEPGEVYAETAHQLAKAGLVENLDLLGPDISVILVHLKRDIHKTAWSLFNRREFENFGWTWLWWLDPRWRNRIVPSERLIRYGAGGCALWYVLEMRARAAYYRRILEDVSNFRMLEVTPGELSEPGSAREFLSALLGGTAAEVQIPEKKNTTQRWKVSQQEREAFARFLHRVRADPESMGQEFYESGLRLAQGPAG